MITLTSKRSMRGPPPLIPAFRWPRSTARSNCSKKRASWTSMILATVARAMKPPIATTMIT
ncbi:UNVERIFIED_CONTAM: hypothetical protein GTU68_032454 [Idotea baltica]|nr:hypothetical protein [Idotea baltica]